ncbi:hypothetical protein BDV96DRAFT_664720 [Lophiotrema nucula]|uniref:CFEM domain-containing protein n=1 Tax=Lophiotrema nucula TaxID=690887 RepID=A0A6A5YYV9_9PLEO|nr:hypothetical protein BDV96DRAFT_664720 [Lophiotrema nucula]
MGFIIRPSAARDRLPSATLVPLLLLALLQSTAALPRNLPLLSAPENPNSFSSFDLIARQSSPETSDALPPSDLIRRQSQSTLSSLQIPSCALACFINTLTTDGCASETDFKCHCSKGNILGKSAACVQKACSDADEKDAERKLKAGCASVGVDVGDGGDGDDGDGTSSTARSGPSSATSISSSSATGSSSTSSPTSSSSLGQNPNPDEPTAAPAPAPTASPPSSSPTSTLSRSSKIQPAMPTDTPLALLPPSSRPLSTSAKVGIGLSVSILFSSLLILVVLYIRRLKRELKAAQAAAGIPDEVWRAHIQTSSAAGGGIERRSSSKSSGGGSLKRKGSWKRRGSIRGRSPPVSPLSPEMTLSFDERGVLQKNKRGHVLSVVVERAEEEDSLRTLTVHEPVPGQKEGLVDPLELDSQDVVELPTSITPRTRSRDRERSRSRGSPRTSLESLGRALTRPRGRSFGDRDRDRDRDRGEGSTEKGRFG